MVGVEKVAARVSHSLDLGDCSSARRASMQPTMRLTAKPRVRYAFNTPHLLAQLRKHGKNQFTDVQPSERKKELEAIFNKGFAPNASNEDWARAMNEGYALCREAMQRLPECASNYDEYCARREANPDYVFKDARWKHKLKENFFE